MHRPMSSAIVYDPKESTCSHFYFLLFCFLFFFGVPVQHGLISLMTFLFLSLHLQVTLSLTMAPLRPEKPPVVLILGTLRH